MKDFERIEQLIHKTTYTSEDLEWIDTHLGGIEAIEELKSVITMLKSEKQMDTSRTLKSVLSRAFRQKHQPAWRQILSSQFPAAGSLAVILLLAIGLYMLRPTREVLREVTQRVEVPGPVDTVWVQTPADTIYITQTQRVEVPVYVTVVPPEEEAQPDPAPSRPISERAELTDILVSSD